MTIFKKRWAVVGAAELVKFVRGQRRFKMAQGLAPGIERQRETHIQVHDFQTVGTIGNGFFNSRLGLLNLAFLFVFPYFVQHFFKRSIQNKTSTPNRESLPAKVGRPGGRSRPDGKSAPGNSGITIAQVVPISQVPTGPLVSWHNIFVRPIAGTGTSRLVSGIPGRLPSLSSTAKVGPGSIRPADRYGPVRVVSFWKTRLLKREFSASKIALIGGGTPNRATVGTTEVGATVTIHQAGAYTGIDSVVALRFEATKPPRICWW